MNIALVYQGGIANVFSVETFDHESINRGAVTRLLQNDFRSCEWFARGARAAGADVRVFGCNMAGDIIACRWSDDRGPFRNETRWGEKCGS